MLEMPETFLHILATTHWSFIWVSLYQIAPAQNLKNISIMDMVGRYTLMHHSLIKNLLGVVKLSLILWLRDSNLSKLPSAVIMIDLDI